MTKKRRRKPVTESRRLRLIRFYHSESVRCARTRAYLAASVFLAAALEGMLMETVACFPSKTRRTATWRIVSRRRKNLLYWNLGELIELANETGWLPANFRGSTNTSWRAVNAAGTIGDFVHIVRETRNLIHPGKYLREHPSLVVKAAHYRDCYEIVERTARTPILYASEVPMSFNAAIRAQAPGQR